MLKEGTTAPAFKTTDQNGESVSLKELRGQKGRVCTFTRKTTHRDARRRLVHSAMPIRSLRKKDITVLGVSPDKEAAHKKFVTKYQLPFTLLADTDHSIAEAYGVWGEKKFMGRTYLGVHRTTFLIDEKGKIRKIFEKVKPEDHASEVLEAFAD